MSFTAHQKDTIKNAVKKVFGEENVTLSPKSGNSIIKYELGTRKKSTIIYTIGEFDDIKVELAVRLPSCPVKSSEGYLTLLDNYGFILDEVPMTITAQTSVIQSLIGTCI
jgi:hypothetical protein